MNIERVNSELAKHISSLILFKLKDPRIHGTLTVTGVETTRDLKFAKVYVSYYGDEAQKEETFEGLNSSANFIRNELKDLVRIRLMPKLTFLPDDSADYARKMDKLIAEATKSMVYFEDDDNDEE